MDQRSFRAKRLRSAGLRTVSSASFLTLAALSPMAWSGCTAGAQTVTVNGAAGAFGGGTGGTATATLAGNTSSTAYANGGIGGADNGNGFGGLGGMATANANASGVSFASPDAYSYAYATGGNGGLGASSINGDAGAASATAYAGSAYNGSASATAIAQSGTTGQDLNSACGFASDVSLVDAVVGISPHGSVNLNQIAIVPVANNLGNTDAKLGGNATSSLTVPYTHGENNFTASTSSTAGPGGTVGTSGSGAKGGNATSLTSINSSGITNVEADSSSLAGNGGGALSGLTAIGGDGIATSYGRTSGGGSVLANANGQGGTGGNGDVYNASTGSSGANGGLGQGTATAICKFSIASANATGTGGEGGSGGCIAGFIGGTGGQGDATATATSLYNNANATAYAYGGGFGNDFRADGSTPQPGSGGFALAQATATTITATATASATAQGGGGGSLPGGGDTEGSAEAIAIATAGALTAEVFATGNYANQAIAYIALSAGSPTGTEDYSYIQIGGRSGLVFNQSSGALNVNNTYLPSGKINAAVVNSGATYNMTGGSLTTPLLINNGTFNFSGGLLYPTLTTNNGTFNALAGSPQTITGSLNVSSGATLYSSPGTQLTVTGTLTSSGTATVDGLVASSLVINAGTFTIRDQSTADSVTPANNVSSLSMATTSGVPAGTLNLKNNQLTINYGGGTAPTATVQLLLAHGYNGGAWNGSGISSSTAAARATIGPITDLGYNVSGTSVNIAYVLAGDANLDGTVNGVDLAIAASYGGPGKNWYEGDFNYDGYVNGIDYAIAAENFGDSITTTPDRVIITDDPREIDFAPLLAFAEQVGDLPTIETIIDNRFSAVPEPSSFAALAIGGIATLRRRRR